MKRGYSAVVESGSHSEDGERWAEREHCGHVHKSIEAAEECGKRHYAAKYVKGSWQARREWHGYTVHDQEGRRVEERATGGAR